jgi:hypothetical protein
MQNSFLGCYFAAMVSREKELRRLADRLSRRGVCLVKDVVSMSGRAFWKQYPSSDRTKRLMRKCLKDMGLHFGYKAA